MNKPGFSFKAMDQPCAYVGLLIVLLSFVLYIPFLALPFLPDDYLQITLARQYGPVTEWRHMMEDPLYRSRATSLIVTYWTDLLFPLSRLALGISSILLHAANGLLVYSLGAARSIGWRLSAVMAVVFVIQERHHEAVVWYAAVPELLVFLFALSCLFLWIKWLHSEPPSLKLWLGAALCFGLALLSKESGVAVIPLMAVLALAERAGLRRTALGLLPVAVIGAAYVAIVFSGRDVNHHFVDGTFALQAGFIKTLLLSAGRGLWVWGWVGLLAVFVMRAQNRILLVPAFGWIAAALLPYSFLSYMDAVPSRHHYLAAVGCSLIVAMGIVALLERFGSAKVAAICLIVIGLHHTSYLWTSKYRQFEKRSEPIEAFINFLETEPRRPVVIQCSDFYFFEIQRAAYLRSGEPRENLVLDFSGGNGQSPAYCLPGL